MSEAFFGGQLGWVCQFPFIREAFGPQYSPRPPLLLLKVEVSSGIGCITRMGFVGLPFWLDVYCRVYLGSFFGFFCVGVAFDVWRQVWSRKDLYIYSLSHCVASETFSGRNKSIDCALAWFIKARDSESDHPFYLVGRLSRICTGHQFSPFPLEGKFCDNYFYCNWTNVGISVCWVKSVLPD